MGAIELTSKFTVSQVLERDDFSKRFGQENIDKIKNYK